PRSRPGGAASGVFRRQPSLPGRPESGSSGVISLDLGPQFWIRLLEIGFLNLLLSGDNAVLIALAVRSLPRRHRILGQVWGAAAALMGRYPAIIWIGGGILGYVAGDMILEDPVVERRLGAVVHALAYPFPLAVAAILTGVGWWLARRQPSRRAT